MNQKKLMILLMILEVPDEAQYLDASNDRQVYHVEKILGMEDIFLTILSNGETTLLKKLHVSLTTSYYCGDAVP